VKKGKRFPIVPVAAAVASLVTALLVTLLIWWRMRPNILGKQIPSHGSFLLFPPVFVCILHIGAMGNMW
jgi:hypothetical protein